MIQVGGKRKGSRSRRKKVGLAVLWAILGLVALIIGLTLQITLALIAAGLSVLAGLATALLPDDPPGTGGTGRPVTSPNRAGSANPGGRRGSGSAPGPGGRQVVLCTETGRPTGECPQHKKHVLSERGVEQFKKPLGTPLVKGGSK